MLPYSKGVPMKVLTILFVLISVLLVYSSEHGIYLRLIDGAKEDLSVIEQKINANLTSSGFELLRSHEIASPDKATEDKSERCGRQGRLLLYQNPEYTQMLTRYGNKYLVAAFIKVGILQTDNGWQVLVTDPETINRIVFNDLDDKPYQEVITQTKDFRKKLINAIHQSKVGKNETTAMPPVRDAEDIRDAAKDMFMMVGPLTFFEDVDQFPQIFSAQTPDIKKGVLALRDKVHKNIEAFTPDEDDASYNWSSDPADLKWRIIGEVFSPDSSALLIGITRPRTEALSFKIAGESRASDQDKCPGFDHLCAYPVEVLILGKDKKVVMHTAREMFRMDMYFWDAGKMAFMNYMNMPSMLDDSIKKALLGQSQ